MYDIWVLVALGGVSVIAGFVDAVAGGGGLITIPALLWAGLPPLGAIATNKAQSIVGTTIAAWTYWRQGYVSILSLVPSIGAAFAGSFLGAVVVKQVDTSALEVLIPAAVIAVALYFTFSPSIKDIDGAARLRFATFVPVFAFALTRISHAPSDHALAVVAIVVTNFFFLAINITTKKLADPYGHDLDDIHILSLCELMPGACARILETSAPPRRVESAETTT